MPPNIPSGVRGIARDMGNYSGSAPEVSELDPNKRWRITASNGRASLVGEVFIDDTGSVARGDIQVFVDGQPREVKSSRELLQVFKDPDTLADDVDEDSEKLSDMPPSRPLAEAPAVVQHAVRQLAKQVRGLVEVEVGHADGRWVIGFELADLGLRLVFRVKGGRWQEDDKRSQYFYAGRDLARVEIPGGLLKLVLANLRGALPRPSGTSAVTGSSEAARSNAVEIRQGTVRRN